MELKQISDRVYYLSAEERTDRPILGYIKGDKYSLAVDAGNSAKHVYKFYQELNGRGLKTPDFTVITHWHWDHTFGMHAVSGQTVASHYTNQELDKVNQWQWTDDMMAKRLESGEDIEICDRCIKLEYPDRSQIKVIKASMEFTSKINIYLEGVHCEISEFIAPHSDDSVLVHVPEAGIVFIGDADSGDYYHNNGAYDPIKLEKMIETIGKINANMFISGHDIPITKQAVIRNLNEELARKL